MRTPHPVPPNLPTLNTKPTWHNRAGRIDRSACFTLTAAQLWRTIPDDRWTYHISQPSAHDRADRAAQNPDRVVTRRLPKGLCDRHATRTLYARDLWLMHKWQLPKRIQGDHRTPKSNAMRCPPFAPFTGRLQPTFADNPHPASTSANPSATHSAAPDTHAHTRHTLNPTNPNRGVGFNLHKMLGLDCLWQTTLRIERYIQHAKLKQHFLVCPVCGPRNDGSSGADIPVCHSAQPKRSNPVGQSPHAKPQRLPRGRVTKLFLPLCTPQEYADAQTAQLWLATHCHPNRPWPPAAAQLIERYGELFDPAGKRSLRCRQCLSLRYGEVKAQQPAQRLRVQSSIRNNQSSIRTEQSLFLNNLPKRLAPVPDASQTQRRRTPDPQSNPSASNQSSITNQSPLPTKTHAR